MWSEYYAQVGLRLPAFNSGGCVADATRGFITPENP